MLTQIIHLGLAAVAAYFTVGALKWKKLGDVKVHNLDGAGTVLFSLGLGIGYVWVLGVLAGMLGVHSGLGWLPGGLAVYAVNGLAHEFLKGKAGKPA